MTEVIAYRPHPYPHLPTRPLPYLPLHFVLLAIVERLRLSPPGELDDRRSVHDAAPGDEIEKVGA